MSQLFDSEDDQEHSDAVTPLSEYSTISLTSGADNKAPPSPLLIPLPNAERGVPPAKTQRPVPTAAAAKQRLKFGLTVPSPLSPPLLTPSAPAPRSPLLAKAHSYEEDLKRRPDAPDAAAYEAVPVAEFGAAMLRGMGWSGEGESVGASSRFRPVLRPERLGLGSSQPGGPAVQVRRPVEQRLGLEMTEEEEKRLLRPKRWPLPVQEEPKEPKIQKNSNVLIINGPHKDLVGLVKDLQRHDLVLVHLLKSRQDVLVGIQDLRLIDTAFRQSRPTEPVSTPSSNWLYPGLKVRIVSKHSFEQGRYYRQYGVIADVVQAGSCTLRLLHSQQILHNVPQTALETSIPRRPDPHRPTVRLVQSTDPALLHHLFRVLELDDYKHSAIVQWDEDHSTVISVKYDAICEFVE